MGKLVEWDNKNSSLRSDSRICRFWNWIPGSFDTFQSHDQEPIENMHTSWISSLFQWNCDCLCIPVRLFIHLAKTESFRSRDRELGFEVKKSGYLRSLLASFAESSWPSSHLQGVSIRSKRGWRRSPEQNCAFGHVTVGCRNLQSWLFEALSLFLCWSNTTKSISLQILGSVWL